MAAITETTIVTVLLYYIFLLQSVACGSINSLLTSNVEIIKGILTSMRMGQLVSVVKKDARNRVTHKNCKSFGPSEMTE